MSIKAESSIVHYPSGSNCQSSDYCNRVLTVISQNTDLIQSVSYTTWNALIFLSRLFKQIPDYVGHASKCILSLHSYVPLSVNLTLQDLSKHLHDVNHSICVNDKKAMLLTTLKVVAKVADTFLILAGTVASFASLAGSFAIATALYQLMIPIGIASLAVTIFFDIYDYIETKSLIGKINKIEESKIDDVTRQVIRAINHKPSINDGLGCRVVRQIDTWTLNNLNDPSWEKIKQALESTQDIKSRALIKRAIGYLAMLICRMYPNTLLQGGLQLGMSLYYTLDLAYTKWLHYIRNP